MIGERELWSHLFSYLHFFCTSHLPGLWSDIPLSHYKLYFFSSVGIVGICFITSGVLSTAVEVFFRTIGAQTTFGPNKDRVFASGNGRILMIERSWVRILVPDPREIVFLKIILFSIFMIFNNFHKQHKCNNRLTNNSINNCSFCFLFTPFFWKFFRA